MLLALVGVFILSIGMYTSYNLSRAVYEKIQLQNAADATAYSLATLEARTFNFIAFANRAQIANYVQMMEAQSLLSNATHLHGMAGVNGELAIQTAKLLKILPWTATLGGIIEGIGRGLEAMCDVIGYLLDTEGIGMETTVKNFIKLKTTENYFLFLESFMLMAATSMQLLDGGRTIVEANDPDAQVTPASTILNLVNTASYIDSFDLSAARLTGPPAEDKRIVAELANASRFSSTGNDRFIVSRLPAEAFTNQLAKLGEAVASRNSRGLTKKFMDGLNEFATQLNVHIGTTKLISNPNEEELQAILEYTGDGGPETSDLTSGDHLVAKDIPELLIGIRRFGFASVVSGPTKAESMHCRYEKPTDYGETTPKAAFRMFATVSFLGARSAGKHAGFTCEAEDDDHTWKSFLSFLGLKGGITPYIKFKPGHRTIQAEKKNFRQPDVWISLNKPPSAMALGGSGSGVNDLSFEMRHKNQTAKLDANIGESGMMGSGFGDGLNVISRAQVYYHRPGAWREPPNLFNPFWGARLAPKGVVIDRLGSVLPEWLSQMVADNVFMH